MLKSSIFDQWFKNLVFNWGEINIMADLAFLHQNIFTAIKSKSRFILGYAEIAIEVTCIFEKEEQS